MKVKVNKTKCIGCSACVALCPKYFELDNNMISKIKKEIIEKKDEKSVREATDSCPANAI